MNDQERLERVRVIATHIRYGDEGMLKSAKDLVKQIRNSQLKHQAEGYLEMIGMAWLAGAP